MKKLVIGVIVGAIILAAGIGGFLHWWYNIRPNQGYERYEPPKLFGKDDYQIVDRQGEKYIVVDKVGLEAKVPTGWTISVEGDDYPEPEYWVNLASIDAELENNILKKGCDINITAGMEKNNNLETKNNIESLENNLVLSDGIWQDYTLQVITINESKGLKWLSPNKQWGQFTGIHIPISNNKLISFDATLLPGYQQICQPIWEEFINGIKIE